MNKKPEICHFYKEKSTWSKIRKYGLRYYFCSKTTTKATWYQDIRAEEKLYYKIIPCNDSKEVL